MRRKADELDSLKKTNAEKFFRKIPRKWQETDFKIIFPTNIIGIPRLVRDNKNFLVRVRSVGLKIFLVRVGSGLVRYFRNLRVFFHTDSDGTKIFCNRHIP